MLQQIKPTPKVRGNLVVGQSGSPTAVFNTCLYGAIEAAKQHPEIQNTYGMVHGVGGLLKGDLIDLGRQNPKTLEGLKNASSAALASSRDAFADEDSGRALEICKKYKIRFLIYMGDKAAMSTVNRLAEFADSAGYPLCCMGIPHSVENNLGFTDHCFGYGTAARSNAIMTRNVGRDAEALGVTEGVKIIETLGRNSGWLAAATALAKDSDDFDTASGFDTLRDSTTGSTQATQSKDSGPHLIYLPESGLDAPQFLADVEAIYRRLGYCLVTVSEGVKDKGGSFLDPREPPTGGVGAYLCNLIANQLKLKASCDKLGTLSRLAVQTASEVDSGEAFMAGQAAVRRAVDGMNGFMITISRHLDPKKPYSSSIGMVRLRLGAQSEKAVPENFINKAGNFVTEAFWTYALPLIGERLPEDVRLERIPVDPTD